MICFEVRLNGKVVCTVGVGDFGGLHALLGWIKRDPRIRHKGMRDEEWNKETLDLNVLGSISHGERGLELWDWLRDYPISIGDELTIKVLSQDACDPPTVKRIETTEFVQEDERKYYESMKRKYEEGKDADPD